MINFGTLCYLESKGRLLLGKKKYGRAKGKLNGFGGHFEKKDASFKSSLIREFKEETSIDILNPKLCGILVFKEKLTSGVVFIYKSKSFIGEPTESQEMTVSWHRKSSINTSLMWMNDQVWFSLFQNNLPFIAVFSGEKIGDLSSEITIKVVNRINEKDYQKYI